MQKQMQIHLLPLAKRIISMCGGVMVSKNAAAVSALAIVGTGAAIVSVPTVATATVIATTQPAVAIVAKVETPPAAP